MAKKNAEQPERAKRGTKSEPFLSHLIIYVIYNAKSGYICILASSRRPEKDVPVYSLGDHNLSTILHACPCLYGHY